MSWEQGRSTIEDMLKKGTLEKVPPSVDAARSLLEVA
jgi:hypothetical protein